MVQYRIRLPRAAVFLCCLLFSFDVFPQSATQGAVAGSVADATGAAIPGAAIRLESLDSHAIVQARSNTAGEFTFPALDPGRWLITATAPNMAAQRRGPQQQIDIVVGRITSLPLMLTPTAAQSVTVIAQSEEEVQSDATVSTNIGPVEVSSLPVNARRWNNFALLAPTATPDGASGDISFRAMPGELNYRTLDGTTNSPAFAAQDNPRTRAAFTVSQSAVREFQVNVATYSAQYGRAAGAVIDTVTARGSDAVHGNIFFYDRDNSWLSRTPGVELVLPRPDGTLVSQPLPSDDRLQGGLAAGGRVPRRALPGISQAVFWHYTFDRQDRNFPALSTVTNSPQTVLSQALPSDFGGFNPVGQTCEDSANAGLTQGLLRSTGSETASALYGTQGACFLNLFDSTLYPTYAAAAAAYNNGLAYIYSLLGPVPRSSRLVSNLPRLDINLNAATTLTVAWNRIRSSAPNGSSSQPYVNESISSLGSDSLSLDDVSARLNTVATPHSDNELRLGYAHDSESQYAHAPLAQEPHTAPGGLLAPGINVSRTLSLGTPPALNRNAYPRESRVQLADAVALVRGPHLWHAGVDFIHTSDAISALAAQAGDYRYTNIQDLLIDIATQSAIPSEHCGESGTTQHLCYSSYEQGFGAPALSFSTNLYAVYLQDDWKVARTLTLNLGVRYDYQQLPPAQIPNPALAATQHLPSDRNNFAPRLGFAWNAGGRGAAVLRGGYGIFYATTPGTTLYNVLQNTGLVSAQSRGQARYLFTTGADSPRYPTTLAAPPTNLQAAPTVTVLAPHFQQPSVQQASLTAEATFSAHTTIHATGLLSLARDLPIVIDTNLPVPGQNNLPPAVTYLFAGGGPLDGKTTTVPFYAGPRPNTSFGPINTIESRVNATYSALTMGVRHTTLHNLDLRAHYTWSHAIDFGEQTSSAATRSEVLDPNNFAAERGNAALNRPNRLVFAAVWTPALLSGPSVLQHTLNGFVIAPIVQVASGAPYSATIVGTAPSQLNAAGSQDIRPTSFGYLGAGGAEFLPLLGRNRYRQPLTQATDLRIGRRIPLPGAPERLHLTAAVEAFNLLNHRNVSSGSTGSAVNTIAYRLGSGQTGFGTAASPALATYQPNFGQPVSANATTLFTSRQLQFALRLAF